METSHPYESFNDGSLVFNQTLNIAGSYAFDIVFDSRTVLSGCDSLVIYDSINKTKIYFQSVSSSITIPTKTFPGIELPVL